MLQPSCNSVLHNVDTRNNREKLRKTVNLNLEGWTAVLLLKLSPHPVRCNLEDVRDAYLTWYQEEELTNGEQTFT